MTVYSLFITCPRGLEAPLTQELENIACQDIRAVDGGVACKGTMEQVYRINLHSRVASRVLLRLTKGGYRNEHDIYKLARNLHWTGWFKLEQPLKVKVEGKRANVKSLDFVGLKIKDAVCDAFRDIYDDLVQQTEIIEANRELASDIRENFMTYNSLKSNNIMMTLTVISTIFLPLTFIVGLYGMNFKNMPELEWQYGYFLVVAIMFGIAFGMLWVFKKKGWLDMFK